MAWVGVGAAHQKNRHEQTFAFCSGLGFTFGSSGSIVPARAGMERRCAALAAVKLPLLLEETAGMLEISSPSRPSGTEEKLVSFSSSGLSSQKAKKDPGYFDNLKADSRNVTNSMTFGTKSSNQNFIISLNKIQATITGYKRL
ncbi:hypothetical protein JEQ12_002247 [Ovis aries]|uniref:Uncharacterized protein n=1 Tax=Ovis aries TaxID=9940 RepID=A0A836D023_SHEEP|nr:hypothetical protein JEQ12_002247 [Ovis aries]